MSIELLPVGQACNLKCSYCYENPMREAWNIGGAYDINAMLRSLDKYPTDFALFGGEPLLVKLEDLEKIFAYGFKRFKKNGIQTNGVLITSKHIELFKQYNVHVGFSIDGAGSLNTPRCNHDETEIALHNLEELVRNQVSVGLIITLHRYNASKQKLPYFKDFLKYLDDLPIYGSRLHLLEGHHDRSIELSEQETIDAFLEIAKFEIRELKNLRFDKFSEMLSMIEGTNADVSCVWRDCDPYTTDAVQGINGDGSSSNCGRANKDGVNWLKSDSTSHVRQIALYNTPQEYGGCKDCRFFLFCRGHCPGTAIDTDWRNRTEHCGVIKALYTYFEENLLNCRKVPLSLSPTRLRLEADLLTKLGNKTNQNVSHEDWHINDGRLVIKFPVRNA